LGIGEKESGRGYCGQFVWGYYSTRAKQYQKTPIKLISFELQMFYTNEEVDLALEDDFEEVEVATTDVEMQETSPREVDQQPKALVEQTSNVS
jgi:hypothetical protein